MKLYYTENTEELREQIVLNSSIFVNKFVGKPQNSKYVFILKTGGYNIYTGLFPLKNDRKISMDDFVKICAELCPKSEG